jgi:hypothetical protein
MRRFAAVTAILAAFAGGTVAGAAPTSPPHRVACGFKAVDFYFWRRGHPAIRRIGFPAFATF